MNFSNFPRALCINEPLATEVFQHLNPFLERKIPVKAKRCLEVYITFEYKQF